MLTTYYCSISNRRLRVTLLPNLGVGAWGACALADCRRPDKQTGRVGISRAQQPTKVVHKNARSTVIVRVVPYKYLQQAQARKTPKLVVRNQWPLLLGLPTVLYLTAHYNGQEKRTSQSAYNGICTICTTVVVQHKEHTSSPSESL